MKTQYSQVVPSETPGESKYICKHYPSNDFGLLMNVLASKGEPGKVLEIKAAKRKGNLNFVSCMRSGLLSHYGIEKPVGLGGTFVLKSGEIKAHIMPCYPKNEILNQQHVEEFLKFYKMQAPLTCLSIFVTHDSANLGLRMEHTHFFSDHNQGGHYHYDTTPEIVEYFGYYVPCDEVYRVEPATW